MKFSCERCGRTYVADEKVRGRAFKMRCKQCGNVITVAARGGSASTRSNGVAPSPTGSLSMPPVAPAAGRATAGTEGGSSLPAEVDSLDLAAKTPGPSPSPANDPFAQTESLEVPKPGPFTDQAPRRRVAGARDETEAAFADLARDLDSTTGEQPLDPPMSSPAAPPTEPEAARDPFAGVRLEPGDAAPVARPDAGATASAQAEADFVDLGGDLDSTTGERPLVAQARGVVLKLAPTPPASRKVERTAECVEVPPPAPRPEPAGAASPASRSKLLAVLGGGVALVAVAAGAWLYLRPEAPAPARPVARAPVAPRPPVAVSPAPAASPALPAPVPPAPAAQPSRAAAPQADEVEVPIAGAPPVRTPEVHRPADRTTAVPARKAMPAPKVAAPAPKVAAPAPKAAHPPHAAERPGTPAPVPERKPAPPGAAVASRPEPSPAPSAPAPAADSPAVTPAPPPAASNEDLSPLDDGRIEATFAQHMKDFHACVAEARANEPGVALDGRTVTVTMTVNPNGRVLYPTLDDAELNGTGLGKCIKRESGKIQFPAFGGGSIRVRKPITLR